MKTLANLYHFMSMKSFQFCNTKNMFVYSYRPNLANVDFVNTIF